jgi:indolepyruvate ferredoxin oxidoreductase beta subunit
MKLDKVATATTNVLIVGVGGQGVIMISKVLAELCQRQGHQVKQSEVHGMAKRGGGVFSHVRFGERVWSPTIPRGEADILLALEWAEALRWLNFLKPDKGTFIADTQHIVPPFACIDRRRGAADGYARETPGEILERVAKGYALDAGQMAAELGNQKVANTILLGALSTALDFPVEDWQTVLLRSVPPKTKDLNLQAFELGRDWVAKAADAPSPPAVRLPPEALEGPAVEVELEIIEAWCKGCDICVKMCPERCLALNAEQVAILTDAAACTGCGICEWLCPDFAIAVHKRTRDQVGA